MGLSTPLPNLPPKGEGTRGTAIMSSPNFVALHYTLCVELGKFGAVYIQQVAVDFGVVLP